MQFQKVRKIIVSSAIVLVVTPIQPMLAQEVIPIPSPSIRKEIKIKDTVQKPVVKPSKYQSACPAVLSKKVVARTLPEISNNQCGERSPLKIESIAGISFASEVILNCRMATSLVKWIEKAKVSAKTILKDELLSINNSTSYDCRKRRGTKRNKISEHAFANALDITSFNFKENDKISVLKHWQSDKQDIDKTKEAKFLTSLRDQACNHFTTVLSPESNAAHKDHFHFDLGCHGKKCTYKICE